MRAWAFRLDSLTLVLALGLAVSACQATAPRAAAPDPPDVEWRAYGGTYASARYSPLAQIDRTNVGRLRVAWRWRSPDHDVMAQNPIVDRYVGGFQPIAGPEGLPLFKPPYGRIVAIDLNTGEHAWTVPLGEGPRTHPTLAALDLPRLGSARRGFPLLTRTLLFAAQEGRPTSLRPALDRPWTRIWTWALEDPSLEAFDKTTGTLLARIELPANAQGALMTYMTRGRQYIVIPMGGANLPAELVALSLP